VLDLDIRVELVFFDVGVALVVTTVVLAEVEDAVVGAIEVEEAVLAIAWQV
jgi:hypothetical protein